jgi:uncharacterized protein YjbI with pentapeptide repeats
MSLRTRVPAALATAVLVASLPVVVSSPAYAVSCPTVAVDGTVTPAPAHAVDWSGCVLVGASLAGADMTGMLLVGTVFRSSDLTGADLTGADAAGSQWDDSNVTGADLSGAVLTGARSSKLTGTPINVPLGFVVVGSPVGGGAIVGPGTQVHDVDLSGAHLGGLDLTASTFTDVVLDGADLGVASLVHTTLTDAVLTHVSLVGTDLHGAVLTRTRGRALTGTPLLDPAWTVTSGLLVGPGVDLGGAVLDGADLSGRSLAGADLRGVRLRGTNLAGADLSNTRLGFPDLTGADLTGATLAGAELTRPHSGGIIGAPVMPTGWKLVRGWLVGPGAYLDWATLAGTDLRGVSLANAELLRTDLTGSNLAGMDLQGAYIAGVAGEGADFSGAHLAGATIVKNDLMHADFRGASFGSTPLGSTTTIDFNAFDEANFTGAVGLETSTISRTAWTNTICPDGHYGYKHVAQDCLQPADVAPPTLTVTPAPSTWVGTDAHPYPVWTAHAVDDSTNAFVRYRWRTAPVGTTRWSAYSYSDWGSGPDVAQTLYWDFGMEPRICVQVQAKDDGGNATAWTAEKCTDIALDEIYFLPKGGFKESGFTPGYSGNNVSSATTKGASLTLDRSSYVKRIAVEGRACPTCGSVAVYVGSTKVGTASFASATTVSRRLVTLPTRATRLHGVVRLVVTSATGRLVRIDGVMVSAY